MYRDFLHGLGHLIFNLSFDITSPHVLQASVTIFIHWPERSVGLSAGLKSHLLSLYRSLIEHDGIALTHYMWVKPWRWRSACIHPTGLWKIGLEEGVEAMRKSVVNFFCMFFLALLSQLLYPNAQLPI